MLGLGEVCGSGVLGLAAVHAVGAEGESGLVGRCVAGLGTLECSRKAVLVAGDVSGSGSAGARVLVTRGTLR
ncbi:hypothetical protein CF645_38200 [Burkholderia pseudomallei]|nr:hypothetical protein CF645_38200 [Burkholderia pseudomallei]